MPPPSKFNDPKSLDISVSRDSNLRYFLKINGVDIASSFSLKLLLLELDLYLLSSFYGAHFDL